MARRLGNENKEENGQETHWKIGERFFMKEAKERASGAVKRDWDPRLIEARYLGQHARTGPLIGITTDGIVCGRLGRRLPEAERWDRTGWQDLKGAPQDLRPTGVLEPEVDVEAQPGAAEAEQRERRWQRPRGTQEPVRDEPSTAPASASDAAEDDGIQSKRTRGKDTRG